jgi:hypothetical protein
MKKFLLSIKPTWHVMRVASELGYTRATLSGAINHIIDECQKRQWTLDDLKAIFAQQTGKYYD